MTDEPTGVGETPQSAPHPRVSVVVITWNRPLFVASCLDHLERLTERPHQILIVDASPGPDTAAVVAGHPGATRHAFPGGAGHMTHARNEALLHATGDVIAFLDDDANVRPEWMTGLLEAYRNSRVAAVAGRTCNPGEDEEHADPDTIGRMLPSGELTGNFGANPGRIITIDHGIGANMSFRREVLARLGGFRDDYPGTALREDTDIFLRLRQLGLRAVFAPAAVVDHVGAPHVKGRRFDWRYQFWAHHNHMLLLARTHGIGTPATRQWARVALARSVRAVHARCPRSFTRPLVSLAGIVAGVGSAARTRRAGSSPTRDDPRGREIRAALSRVSSCV